LLQVQRETSPHPAIVGTATRTPCSSSVVDVKPVTSTRLVAPSLLFAHARPTSSSPLSSTADLPEADVDDINEAAITELTPMLPAECLIVKRPSVNVLVVNERCSSSNHLRSFPKPAKTSSLFEPSQLQSRAAEIESHRQTVVVEVYQPNIESSSKVRRPISLYWKRRLFDEADADHRIIGGSQTVTSSSQSRSAPELRLHTTNMTDPTESVISSSTFNDLGNSEVNSTTDQALANCGNTTKNDQTRFPIGFDGNGNDCQLPTLYAREPRSVTRMSSLPMSNVPRVSVEHRRQITLSLPEFVETASVGSTTATPYSPYQAFQPASRIVPSASEQQSVAPRRPDAIPESKRVTRIVSDLSSIDADSTVSDVFTGGPEKSSATAATFLSASCGDGGSWCEASMELWNLRAMLADRDDFYSVEDSVDDESMQTTSAPAPATTTTPQSADDTSAKSSSDTVVSVVDAEEMRRPMVSAVVEALQSSADVASVDSSPRVEAASGCATICEGDPSSTTGTTALPEDGLRRVPSVRRQTYRNAIARRQQQKNQQRLDADDTVQNASSQTKICELGGSITVAGVISGGSGSGRGLAPPSAGDGSSELTDDAESSISFERHFGTGGYCASISAAASSIETASSFHDSVTSSDSICGGNSSCSEGYGGHGSHRLESLRGDSGYRSLEAQQSLAAAAVIGGLVSSGLVSGSIAGSSREIRRLSVAASAEVIREDERESIVSPETIVKLPSSSTAVRHSTSRMNTGSGANKQHVVVVRHSKAAERKRIQYKCERQAVQIYESVAGDSSAAVTAQQQQQQHQQSVADATVSAGNIGIANVGVLFPSATKSTIDNRHSFPTYLGNSGSEMTGDSFDDQLTAGLAAVFIDQHHHRHHHRRHHQHHHHHHQHHPQCHQNQLQQPQLGPSVSKSSFFSRLLRTSPTGSGSSALSGSSSSSRRCPLVRMPQRDYSVDERSDALFNEFVRHDPAFDSMHTLCVTTRRRSGGHRTHHSGGGRSSRRRNATDSPGDRSPSERRHRLRRVSHDVDRTSRVGDRTTFDSSAGVPMVGTRAFEFTGRPTPSTSLAGPKSLLLGEPTPCLPASSVAYQWLEAAIASAHSRCRDFGVRSAKYPADRRASCGDATRPSLASVDDRSADTSFRSENENRILTSGHSSTSGWTMTSSSTTTPRPSGGASESTMNAIAFDGSVSGVSPELANYSPEAASHDTVGDSSPGSDDAISASEQRSVTGVDSVPSCPHTSRPIPVIQLTAEDETL